MRKDQSNYEITTENTRKKILGVTKRKKSGKKKQEDGI